VSYAQELLETAKRLLIEKNGVAPTRADCNRAASTIYYGLFDCICSAIADRIAGKHLENSIPSDEWTHVYRSISHIALEAALLRVNRPIQEFSLDAEIAKILAVTFKRGKDERTKADYDRAQDVDLDAAKQLLKETESAIFLSEVPGALDFDTEAWLSSLVIELFFSKPKR
jgi:uncharacterized protein (UPF0332 family)